MFYESELSQALRFGDVLRDFVLAEANISDPKNQRSYKINVDNHSFCVVMTPCCSIGNKTLSLAPLVPIRPGFFANPFFEIDLTNINRPMKPEQSVSPQVWEDLSLEEKTKRRKEGEKYAVVDVFIYEKHDLLPIYELPKKDGNILTNFYLVDFKKIYNIQCDKVNSAKDSPFDLKVLELTVQTRNELRKKLAEYYTRIPKEDIIPED